MELKLQNCPSGFYWAQYKDHGWILLSVMEKMSLPRFVYEISNFGPDYSHKIEREDWSKYLHLTLVEEPPYGV